MCSIVLIVEPEIHSGDLVVAVEEACRQVHGTKPGQLLLMLIVVPQFGRRQAINDIPIIWMEKFGSLVMEIYILPRLERRIQALMQWLLNKDTEAEAFPIQHILHRYIN